MSPCSTPAWIVKRFVSSSVSFSVIVHRHCSRDYLIWDAVRVQNIEQCFSVHQVKRLFEVHEGKTWC